MGSLDDYLEKIVMPNLGKIDLYQLADVFNNIYHSVIESLRMNGYNVEFKNKWDKMINGLLQVNINLQWDMERTLKYLEENTVL